MSINSISGSSSSMMQTMQRPDPAKMADDLFSKLDTKGQGYIEKSDLESALGNVSQSDSSSSSSVADALFAKLDGDGNGKVTKEEMSATIQKIASELDGPAPRMRMQGAPPPQGGTPPQGGQSAQGTSSASGTSSSQSDDPADTNGDGTVSASESLAYELSQAASSTDTSSSTTSSADAQLMQMLTGKMPPPRGSGQDDPGFSKDELTSMSQELSSTDSKRSKAMSDIASNFDAADTDGDGKVNGSEARAYEKSKEASTSSSSSASTSDAQFMKQMMQLLQSYGGVDQTETSSFSASV
jgi:Ca2+-binding EF-hand superfamily protein